MTRDEEEAATILLSTAIGAGAGGFFGPFGMLVGGKIGAIVGTVIANK